MKPKLIVANMILQDMIQAKNKERLELYLNSANEKNSFENTIWYAIVPRMEYVGEERNENIRERFRGNDKKSSLEVNSVTELHVLMDMLAKYRVQTFVSPTNSQNTTAEYIYPSFPNFSLMKDMHMEIRMGGNDKGIRYNSFWLREVAIEASYVAAGMFAALQCPEYLAQTLKNKVCMAYPGVGFRILEQEHNIKFPSVLKSGTLMFPQSVLEDVERKCYGVFFAPYGNKVIIVQDRAMTGNYDVKTTLIEAIEVAKSKRQ